ncbi:MAG: hypothetical protein ABI175_16740 [Polyangiales bacterium]
MKRVVFVVALAAVWLSGGQAHAYPQFQLAYDVTCTGCHISPAGGNLLNENGLGVAEANALFPDKPEVMYGAFKLPSWFNLGGDFRSATGYMHTPTNILTFFPMQYELYAAVTKGSFSLHVNAGPRPAQEGNENATRVWSREHYVMWESNPGETSGIYARVGRFMPVYGLRLAEHPAYNRQYGHTRLYGETYGVHVAVVSPKYEAHLTGFIKDPLIDPVDQSSGAMAYLEFRPTEVISVGAEGMFKKSVDDQSFGGGITAKYFVPAAKLLIQAEFQYTNQLIDKSGTNAAGGAPLHLLGFVMGSISFKPWLMLDIGLGHYDSNIRIKDLDRDAADVNLHLFLDSHTELVLMNRIEMLALGNGGPTSGWTLFQLHYRL